MFKEAIFYFILFISLGILPLYSQNGTIVGKVTDAETGEHLPRTTIMLEGTKLGTYSDVKGEYKIKNIPPGKYKLIARYVSYTTKEIKDVVVEADKTLTINIILSKQVQQGKEITVIGVRETDNEMAMLSQRKSATQVSDGISMEEIKRLPDSDAGQSLKRLSGVSLVNDKFVFVRGISERYSNTTLNGAILTSTEPDKKAFSFDMLPSDFLEQASIKKSFTPDLPGNFAGGLVELNTVDYPKKRKFGISLGSSFNNEITMQSGKFKTANGSTTFFLGRDASYFAAPSSIPSSPEKMRNFLFSDIKTTDQQLREAYINKWIEMGRSFKSENWKLKSFTPLPGMGISANYTDILQIAGNDFGLISSINYGNSYSFNEFYRGVYYSDGKQLQHTGNGFNSIFSTSIGAMLNLSYKIGTNNSISLKNTFNNLSDYEIIQIQGVKEFTQIIQTSMEYLQKTMFSSQFVGEHYFDFLNSQLNWRIGYSLSLRDQPDLRRIRYSRNDTTLPYRMDIYNLPQGNSSQAGRFFSYLTEDGFSGALDYKIKFDDISFKIGGLVENRKRDFEVRSFTIVEARTIVRNYYDPNLGYDVRNYLDKSIEDLYYIKDASELNPDKVFAPGNFNIHGLGISEDTKNTDSYKATESLYAGYAMFELPTYLFGNRLRIIGGTRYEISQQKLSSFYPIVDQSGNSHDSVYADKNYFDLLPSINLIYELTKTTNLRMSASQTLARPSLREYAPFTFYDFMYFTNVKGNPSLERSLIQNYDIRYEWFMNPGEVVSISGFYKVFKNAIEETILPASAEVEKTFTNSKSNAYNYGFEFELRKNFGFILPNSFLENIGLNLNYAFINSEITIEQPTKTYTRPMWGQSPYTLNIGLFYNNPDIGTSVNIAYNTSGKRIIQVADVAAYAFDNPHIYEMPRNLVDLSITQRIIEKMYLKIVAKNLLNEKLIWEQNGTKVATNYYGINFSLGLDYSF